ncbi:MAG: spore coat protein [Clostridia bacterium]|nr:spore coat protein [Clostridia bacterium]
MEDRDLMEKELLVIKGVCDLYMHGTLEATTAEVHAAFKDALNVSLDIQNKIYNLMSEKGWYKTCPAEQTKLDQAKQKYSNTCC